MSLLDTNQINSDEEIVEPIYSHGTDQAISKIRELIQTEQVDVIAINIATVARNCMDKDKSIDDNLSMLIEIIERLSKDIPDMFSGSNVHKPYVYFYLFPYHKMIPPDYLRLEGNKNREFLFELTAYYYKYFSAHSKKELIIMNRNDVTVIFHVQNDEGFVLDLKRLVGVKLINPSYSTLVKDIGPMNNKHIVALFTHQPIDCHILKKYKSFVVRSHTGEVLEYKDYGKKIFGLDLPFIPELHVLLGDKELIKGSLGRKEKKLLIEIAERNNWKFTPALKITQEVNNMYNLPYRI